MTPKKKKRAHEAEAAGAKTPSKRKRGGEDDGEGFEPDAGGASQPVTPSRKSRRLAVARNTVNTTPVTPGQNPAQRAAGPVVDSANATAPPAPPAVGTAPSTPETANPANAVSASANAAATELAPPPSPPPTATAAASTAVTPAATPPLGPPPPSAAAFGALPSLSAPAVAGTASTTPLPSFVFPADAPKWLKDSIKDLTKLDLGCHYTSLLAALIRLEGLARYEPQKGGPQRLPSPKATPRPAAISDWVRGG
jgi:hypothetical protein